MAVDLLIDDAEISDAIVGFHLQQATEKLLKAVLAELDQDVRRTHALAYLFDSLDNARTPAPQDLWALRELTPFAVETRYGLLQIEAQPLDRHRMRTILSRLREWAEAMVLSADTDVESR